MSSINMKKGDTPVSLSKQGTLTLKCSWSSNTDYDLYAMIRYTDGRTEYVATFPAGRKGLLSPTYTHPAALTSRDGSVIHHGDVGRGMAGRAEETVSVTLNDSITHVAAVAYSARSNGTGSFRQYQVSMEVTDSAGSTVRIDAVNANASKTVYSCVPGFIVNGPSGPEVHFAELYSSSSSENRPAFAADGSILMDKGPRNAYK